MNAITLPKNFQGYSTAELLDLYHAIRSGTAKGTPPEKVLAMDKMLEKYEISPIHMHLASGRPLARAS